MTMSEEMVEELQSLRATCIDTSILCDYLIANIDDETINEEIIKEVLHDLEVGNYSLYSALNNCLPIRY
jgi:hypothetical protein